MRFGVLCLTAVLFSAAPRLSAQIAKGALRLPALSMENEQELAKTMSGLAKSVMPLYKESDRDRYLSSLFRLQTVAGRYAEAASSLRSLIDLRNAADPVSALPLLPFVMQVNALAGRPSSPHAFEEAFAREFRDTFHRLDDKTADKALYWFGGDIGRARNDVRTAAERKKGKDTITIEDALDLVRKYHFYEAFRVVIPLGERLAAEDDARRYDADRDILVPAPDGARIAALAVRPKASKTPPPALLVFTIYADDRQSYAWARTAAAHGYAGVVGYTRGKGRSPDEPVPYEHDGDDARAVIDWIIRQNWNDGRVGMYGGSYNGFSQWAAAKRPHPALKTIVPYAANNPGDGLPMENNVFLLANYAWAFYVTNNKTLDNDTYYDPKRWNSLNDNWYASGKPYRQVDKIDGAPNKWLQRWLKHPGYDRYWQAMLPYRKEFAGINIPVLTITGYYDDGQQSAVHFLKEHVRFNPQADHYLLIGPYDHFGAQNSRKDEVLRGYAIDPVAQIDTPEITFQWMDYVLRGGKKPDLLKDKINYQIMGANTWRHAPSIEAMGNAVLTLYLTDRKLGDFYGLSGEKPSRFGSLSQKVDLADRKTKNNDYYPWPIVGKRPDLSNGFAFISEPFEEPLEIVGAFSGEIKAVINKKDMDIGVTLYEVMPDGELFHLSYFIGRASYAREMSVRTLLSPGKVQAIPFAKTRLTGRKLSRGSRLLVTLNINKNEFAQINYGTGKDVSDEDIRDAGTPLEIEWRNDSFVRIPVWR
jgi:uncharacterized protein